MTTRTVLVAVLLAVSLLTACGSEQTPPGQTSAPSVVGAKAQPVDACGLLTDPEVTAVLGKHSRPRAGTATDGGSCTWENPDTYHSITLNIGGRLTATGGKLPEPSDFEPTRPGPDGIRFGSGNMTEFAVGDRFCDIQVVTSVTDDSDRDAAVRMIGLVRQRLAS